MPTEMFYAVDRFDRKRAVLVGDSGDEVTVVRADLPAAVREGTVLRVPLDRGGNLDWPAARIDAEEGEGRRREAERLVRELRERDPGGDVEL